MARQERGRSGGVLSSGAGAATPSGLDADSVIDSLELVPHPEGGHYRRTYADEAGSAIYFLLRREEESVWHRVLGRAEIWHLYAGAPIELSVDDGSGRPATVVRLGNDLVAGDRPQAVVAPGVWQRARSTGDWSLAGCTVSPPFTFDAFETRG